MIFFLIFVVVLFTCVCNRMCQMARMVDGALPLRGGALVSRLYAHTQHGDPATKALVRRVLDSVCAPLYTVLSR